MQARSFGLAAEAVSDALGGGISADSVRRLTEGFGARVIERRAAEAERANAVAQREERPGERRLALEDPVGERGNVSTDGAMVRIRGEGWKEAKMTAISAVMVEPVREERAKGRQRGEQEVTLERHSYQAGVWDADTLGRHQYAEALRRGLDLCSHLSTVSDAARWIDRINATSFPDAVQIVDWSHASERVWDVGKALFGEGTPTTATWVDRHLDALWDGHVEILIAQFEGLDLDKMSYPETVRQAPGYFRNNQTRMDYPTYRRHGFPIGSGTVENAANLLVHHRLRRPGRGWNHDHADAMLTGLSELHSNRFPTLCHSLALTAA